MADKTTVFLSGKLYWAKVVGNPHYNKFKDANEWSFEFEPDADGLKVIKSLGLGDRVKTKYADRNGYLVLRKAELNKEGAKNAPIRIYDKDGSDWDRDSMIGNGSSADVKLDIRDYGSGKQKGVYPIAIRVTDLVRYVSSEFGAMDQGKKPAPKKKDALEELLDDELPV